VQTITITTAIATYAQRERVDEASRRRSSKRSLHHLERGNRRIVREGIVGAACRVLLGPALLAGLILLSATTPGAAAQADDPVIFESCDYCEAPEPGDPVPFDDSVLYAMDSDGDGLSDGEEINTYLTSPDIADYDGDGLTDGDEVHVYHTHPALSDTDGDGYPDAFELFGDENGQCFGGDPLDASNQPTCLH
jgi:hypothetical protein